MGFLAIIVAGGEGQRMGSDLPKQFHSIHGKPLLFYTLEAFLNSETCPEIFLVMHEGHLERWINLCLQFNFHIPHTLITGGENRCESVWNGLLRAQMKFGDNDFPSLIGIHDAVRPLVSGNLIDQTFLAAKEFGSAIPSLPLNDSLRILNGKEGSQGLNRNLYRLVQTPQVFSGKEILNAYQERISENYSDDASLFEKSGHPIHLMEGERTNIKITYASDLIYAEGILEKRKG